MSRRRHDYDDAASMDSAVSNDDEELPDSDSQASGDGFDNEMEDSQSSDGDDNQEEEPRQQSLTSEMRSISFGALADAQKALASARHSTKNAPQAEASEKLQALKDRLAELRDSKSHPESKKRKRGDERAESRAHRSSKHAPAEQSSKRQVSRKRQIVELSGNLQQGRDPRFSSISGQLDTDQVKKRYAFLDEYRKEELSELKAALKKAKSEDDKIRLRREIVSRENKVKSEADKDRRQQVIRDHRKKEREAIAQGKNPFYLKRGEMKKMASASKFDSMKAKEKDKAMKKQRKRESEKERRAMPAQRRQRG